MKIVKALASATILAACTFGSASAADVSMRNATASPAIDLNQTDSKPFTAGGSLASTYGPLILGGLALVAAVIVLRGR